MHALTSIEKCADEGTWALLTSQIKPEALDAIGGGEPVAWDVFWVQVRACVAVSRVTCSAYRAGANAG